MCGLTGFFNPNNDLNHDSMRALVQKMSQTIFHRGPDDSGEWVDPNYGIALGFRRLSIIDLSHLGYDHYCADR